jgi:guanyl-specific ribonuclease Sa
MSRPGAAPERSRGRRPQRPPSTRPRAGLRAPVLRAVASVLLLAVLALWQWWPPVGGGSAPTPGPTAPGTAPAEPAWPAFLPAQARPVLARIASGAPHPYRQDGGVFHNRERRLPARPRGWYREYTVDTPGARDRGARRIVTGGQPPSEFWYSADHYRSFRPFQVPP